MFEELSELEGTLFDLSKGECQDQFPGYQTICYGILYDLNSSSGQYYLTYLYTDESGDDVGYSKMYESTFYKCNEDIELPDNSHPEKELIKRVFEYEWK